MNRAWRHMNARKTPLSNPTVHASGYTRSFWRRDMATVRLTRLMVKTIAPGYRAALNRRHPFLEAARES